MEYIDLRLPSGTLWKTANEDQYYAADCALKTFKAALPTKEHFQELLEFTLHWFDTYLSGMWFLGRNGKQLFLPAITFQNGPKLCKSGFYWTASSFGITNRYCFYFDNLYFMPMFCYHNSKAPIRLILPK